MPKQSPKKLDADEQVPETGAHEKVKQSWANVQKRPPGSTAMGVPTKSNLKSKYEDPSSLMKKNPAGAIKRNIPGKTNLSSLLTKTEQTKRPSQQHQKADFV